MNKSNRSTNKWLVAASVSIGAIMAAIDTSVLNVATPHLRGVFSATTSEISWISTTYLLSVIITMPLAGWLCKKYDRKYVCILGLLIFTFASLLCGLAGTLPLLIAARLLQGFGAGILLPVEQVVLRQTFPPHQIGLAMGIYGITVMIGPAIGPLLGGIAIDNYHWSFIFFINVPIGIIGLLLVNKFVSPVSVEEKKALEPSVKFSDWYGVLLLPCALFPLLILLERGERLDWFETQSNVVLLFISLASFMMFCAQELTVEKPAVDLRVLKTFAFSSAIFVSFLLGFVITGSLFVLPLYMQEVLDYSATQAGKALIPRAIAMMISFPIVGLLFNKVSPRPLMFFGLCMGFYSAILMSNLTHESGMLDVVFPQVVQGIAISFILTPLSTVALLHVTKDKVPAAAGLNAFSRQLGGSLGIAVFASLISYFELFVRGAYLHRFDWGLPLLRDRFSNVVQFFYYQDAIAYSTALQQGYTRLNGRLSGQISVVSYQKIFEWLSVGFVLMFLFLILIKPVSTAKASSNE